VNTARTFNEHLNFDGVVLTKLDGDTRGGAALSIKSEVNKPIKFVGTGEKMDALDVFYPERMASRILGMGDVVSLVEKAQEAIDIADVETMQAKIMEATFDFDDFLKQMKLMKNMGSLGGLLKMIPGMGKLSNTDIEKGEKELKRTEAMISSMTVEERKNPDLLAKMPTRRRRIAKGSGHTESDVSKLVTNFTRMRAMMQQMGRGGGMPGMGGMGGMQGMGMPGMGGGKPQPGFRGYTGGVKTKQKKQKKKKGFGTL
jgi:signal recognition particle subunit SRP54